MIVKRPSIFIYTYGADPKVVKEVCAGIEEEGVFYEIMKQESGSTTQLAKDAARDSMLGSGVGIVGTSVAMTMRGLKGDTMIDQKQAPTKEECRNLGANSARVIKKLPLRI